MLAPTRNGSNGDSKVTETTQIKRLAIQEGRLAVDFSLMRLWQGLRAENQFLRSLNRSRRPKANARDQCTGTRSNQTQGKAAPQRPESRMAPGSVQGESRSAAKTRKLPLNTILTGAAGGVVAISASPDLARPELRGAALLQSARAQELRAEIERILTMAMRLAGSARCSDEFRWVLSPLLFPDTTIVLRREGSGWRLDATVGDEECRDVLNGGVAELRRRFVSKDLGDLVVTVEINVSKNEPSIRHGEHTSQSDVL